MITKFPIRKFIELPTVALTLLVVSFLNYCIMQIFGTYFLPLTIVPIFIAGVIGYQIPIILIAGIGLLDDALANGHLGLYSLIYLLLSYFLITKTKDLLNKKYTILVCILAFIVINILTFN